ncbi:UNVERIFIED_CONTAM: Type I inositol polyphosphate 5-phosphatase 8 [Sesamum calycinum]|uniref:Type I inositol polyphosphate 5-phosphatase 8 n=1 Tax=Sesamum calycinum TaxID=2727403 RepID=A0AAW2N382_9LAMI
MREEGKILKSSWPKVVVRKWLNIRSGGSDEFYSESDDNTKPSSQRRRKSCSNDGHRVVVPEELSEEWLMEMTNEERRPGSDQRAPRVSSSLNLRMFVGTWNVGGKYPHNDLDLNDCLKTKEPADVYVLGFQEIVPLNAGNVLGPEDCGPAEKWLSLIRKALNDGRAVLVCVGSSGLESAYQQFEGFMCWKRHHGIPRKQGINIYQHEISPIDTLFICSHLTSGEKEGDASRRNSDVTEILKRTRFSHSCRISGKPVPPYTILDHDNIIWLGDLNYRLASISHDMFELVERHDWQALLEKDQLRIEQKDGGVLEGWEEGEIYFAPTYKYITDSDHYVVQASIPKDKRRTPAWCDRILWRGQGLKQMCYFRGESRFSDHRPVFSLFSLPTISGI